MIIADCVAAPRRRMERCIALHRQPLAAKDAIMASLAGGGGSTAAPFLADRRRESSRFVPRRGPSCSARAHGRPPHLVGGGRGKRGVPSRGPNAWEESPPVPVSPPGSRARAQRARAARRARACSVVLTGVQHEAGLDLFARSTAENVGFLREPPDTER